MSWISDRIRDVGRVLRSDVGKAAILGGIGGYGLFGKAAMNKFLTSSMLKNMARRYATSYLTNTVLGRPHAHRGALSSALWSLPFQAFKNYQLTQPLGKVGMEGYREGTDTPWWKLMLGQGREDSIPSAMTEPLKMVNPKGPSDVFLDKIVREGPYDDMQYMGPSDPYQSVMDWIPAHETQAAMGPDPELGFLDMFMKDKATYGEAEGGGKLADLLGLSGKGPITGYEKGLDPLAFAPEVMGYAASDYTPEEKWDMAKRRTEREQEHYNKLMMNPYYQNTGYQWPGWGLGVNRGGIMQKLNRGGDFLEDLMAQEDEVLMAQEDPAMMSSMGATPEITSEDYGPVGMPEEAMMAEEGIPEEILEGIVNQREPLMEKIMAMIMNMISPTYEEGMEDPAMEILGPRGMTAIRDMESEDIGMMGGGTYAYDNGGYHDMYMDYKSDPTNDFDGTYEEFMEYILPMLDFSPTDNLATGGDYTMGAHVMGPGTGTSDSINAKLSDGEFVVTAKAVENLGGGDRFAGARKMYQMMNSLDPNSARPGEEPQVV